VAENFDPVAHNRAAWDREVDQENEWTRPVGPDVIARARAGDWSVVLIGYEPVPRDWFPADLAGISVLGLASGGGQQGPVLAAAGADVTVFDNSPRQLGRDEEVTAREGLDPKTTTPRLTAVINHPATMVTWVSLSHVRRAAGPHSPPGAPQRCGIDAVRTAPMSHRCGHSAAKCPVGGQDPRVRLGQAKPSVRHRRLEPLELGVHRVRRDPGQRWQFGPVRAEVADAGWPDARRIWPNASVLDIRPSVSKGPSRSYSVSHRPAGMPASAGTSCLSTEKSQFTMVS